MNWKTADQHEIEARQQALELSGRFLRASVEATTGEKVEAPAFPNDDVILGIELMEAHCTELEAKLKTFQSRQLPGESLPSGVHRAGAAVSLPDQSAQLTALTRERDALKAENEQLRAEINGMGSKYERMLAGKLVEHGIGNSRIIKEVPGRKLTATEKVLAEKGASSLTDLEQKREAESRPANQ